jgi:hypothetical protein
LQRVPGAAATTTKICGAIKKALPRSNDDGKRRLFRRPLRTIGGG